MNTRTQGFITQSLAGISFLGILLASSLASADEAAPRVGIVVSFDINIAKDEQRRLAVEIGEALEEYYEIELLSGNEVERRMPQHGVTEECVGSAECRFDLAGRIDADEVLFLTTLKVGSQVQIDPTWYQRETGITLARSAIRMGVGEDHTRELFASAAPELLPQETRAKVRSAMMHDDHQVPDAALMVGETYETERRFTPATWIASGISVAALAAGGAFAFAARDRYNDCQEQPCVESDRTTLRRRTRAADTLFSVAAVSAVSATFFYFNSREERRTATPTVIYDPSAQTVGLGLQGSF
ncbi:hypothetical protein [Haliangium ochraceum]|uniref:TPM domain-containing protein n=1 Tax=Haliangium ochraceum (strain DSM 14365 / JCM 11303 / SMP-2) TaxID=502025 RepID=D0LHC9_HALO1|nr:hypothetical protein [Haliangium ochraceum]ACY18274.1 hypothetical protein Hoch_5798 [Haliangium ochraceum DSM 14365]